MLDLFVTSDESKDRGVSELENETSRDLTNFGAIVEFLERINIRRTTLNHSIGTVIHVLYFVSKKINVC